MASFRSFSWLGCRSVLRLLRRLECIFTVFKYQIDRLLCDLSDLLRTHLCHSCLNSLTILLFVLAFMIYSSGCQICWTMDPYFSSHSLQFFCVWRRLLTPKSCSVNECFQRCPRTTVWELLIHVMEFYWRIWMWGVLFECICSICIFYGL